MNAIETINVYNTACMSPHCAASVPLSCMCPSRRKYIKSVDRRRVAYFKPGPTEGGRSPPPYNKCIVRLILRNDRSGSEKRGGPYIHLDAVRQSRRKSLSLHPRSSYRSHRFFRILCLRFVSTAGFHVSLVHPCRTIVCLWQCRWCGVHRQYQRPLASLNSIFCSRRSVQTFTSLSLYDVC